MMDIEKSFKVAGDATLRPTGYLVLLFFFPQGHGIHGNVVTSFLFLPADNVDSSAFHADRQRYATHATHYSRDITGW